MKITDLIDINTKKVKNEFASFETDNCIDCNKITEDIDDLGNFDFKYRATIDPPRLGNWDIIRVLEFDFLNSKFCFIRYDNILYSPEQFPKASRCFSVAYITQYFAIYKQCDEIYKMLTDEEKLKLELLNNE